jgi:AAA+ superfamily predicted ATPase
MKETSWIKKMKKDYRSGISNFFIVDGNINDYPIPKFLFEDYLIKNLYKDGFDEVHSLTLKKNTSTVENAVKKIKMKNQKVAVIIKHPEQIFPNIPYNQMNHNQSLDYVLFVDTIASKDFIQSDNVFILLTESKYSINQKLLDANSRSSLIQVDFPDYKQRFSFLTYLERTSKKVPKYEGTLEEFSQVTAGLTLVGIEDIYLQGEYQGVLKKEFIIERKNELIKKEYGDVIEIFDTNVNFSDFAGQEHLKKYHKEVIVSPMTTRDTSIVPKGLLYTGPPGTGKTYFAKCLSGEAGINFVELKMSKILDKWVGESEKKFDKALTCIKSIAPVGVFIDEIDQAFSRGENQSNRVDSSLFGMFLTVLSDESNRGKIIWIGAANYPNKIDEALKRAGRFDKKIPFLPPDTDDIIKTFKVHLSKFKSSLNDVELRDLSKDINGYTQAEIESVTIKAMEISKREKEDKISLKNLKKAVKLIKHSNSKKIKEMIKIAINECNDLEFLPENSKNIDFSQES